tara:strand:+ start:10015 stop:10290 length:276 start_codon:yes stop_codon:yes gene_type:complete
MSEEENTQETNEGDSNESSEDGNKHETTEIIKQQRERIEELETKEAKRQEDLAKKQLGGRAEGGKETEKHKEETPEEYANRAIKGDFKLDG